MTKCLTFGGHHQYGRKKRTVCGQRLPPPDSIALLTCAVCKLTAQFQAPNLNYP